MSANSGLAANSWSIHAHHHAKHVTSFTGKGAAALIAFAGRHAPFTAQSKVLDEGAGTGVLTQMLVDMCPGITVTATDFSPGMLQILEDSKLPNVETKVLDATGDHEAQGLRPEHFVEFFMDMQSPAYASMQEAWKGDREEVRPELLKVVREKYSDLQFYLKAACTVGRK